MWQIDHQCPQCGAPVVLEETERFFSCPYCKVKLLIDMRDGLSYRLGPPGLDEDLLYIPYRRSRGIEFTCTTAGVNGSMVDKTTLARAVSSFPRSLGVRPQTLGLRFVSEESKGRFVAPGDPSPDEKLPQDCQTILPGYASQRIPPTVSIRRFLSEAGSMIYAPFRILGEKIYDAISMETVGKVDRDDQGDPIERLPLRPPAGDVGFIPALCPNCGMDLKGDKESVALPCNNCGVLWEPSGPSLSPRPFMTLSPKVSGSFRYLPFWRIRAETSGIETALWVNPAKAANVADRLRPISFAEFRFWIPAFTVNPTLFLRVAERASLWGPPYSETIPFENNEGRNIYPVTLPAVHAAQLLPVVLSLIVDQREARLFQMVKGTIAAVETILVFVPFQKTAAEMYHADMRASILINALKYGRDL
jgi:DNA-directed RNA polymerase subunit RPC12/RpoP